MVLPMWAFWVALAVMVIGLVGIFVPGLPDIWLIWVAALVYAICEKFATIDPITFAVLTVMGIAGVTSEWWVSPISGKLGGASWKALLAGMALGAVGFVIGLFVGGVGAVPASLIGAFLGVFLVEYWLRRNWKEAAQVGATWLAGCLISTVIRLFIALAMVVIFAWQALRG
jgi:hypothetical protein